MNEATRQQIMALQQAEASERAIARTVRCSRHTVRRVLTELAAQRAAGVGELSPAPQRRASKLDRWEPTITDLLARYPRLSAVRVLEELRRQGYEGGYSIVRQRVQQLRPAPAQAPTLRFETGPGLQAQMDYATYTIDFTDEGRRRVHVFGYVLSYSRRQYLCFVERQDLETTLRQHILAFTHLGGVPRTCLYDNMKVVVSRIEDGEAFFNPRFLAFATHYGFRPWACRPRRPQTKGKVERQFSYVETNLLAGRTFRSLAHLNEVTRDWLATVADDRIHGTTGERPRERHAQEQPALLPLPAQPYDPSPVVYRVVDAEGLVTWRSNGYWAPLRYLGHALPVRITENEVIIYSPEITELVRHPQFPAHETGQRRLPPPAPRRPGEEHLQQLRERYLKLGETGIRFLDGLLQERRQGRIEAERVLALLGTYSQTAVRHALERAVRFRAFSRRAVERILAVQAKPKSPQYLLEVEPPPGRTDAAPQHNRSPAEYQSLFSASSLFSLEETSHGPSTQNPEHTVNGADDRNDADRTSTPADPGGHGTAETAADGGSA
ncbi:MAG: IS21 family transposase [Phycisphaerales bacterium]